MVKCSHRAGEVKHENFSFNVFMALIGRGIGACLLMIRLDNLCSLKLKQKSN